MRDPATQTPTVVDPTRTWHQVEQRLAVEHDPQVRRNLETVLRHMRAEAAADLDELMATVADDAHYHAYCGPPETSPAGKEAVRRFYDGVFASGIGRLEFAIDRLVADRGCVVTEGTMRMAWPGTVVLASGIDVDDADADYVYETRMAIFWMFDADGLVSAEDSYAATDGTAGIEARKLPHGWDRDA